MLLLLGTFRPERIEAIAKRFEVDPTSVLDNLVIARAYTHEQQMNLLTGVAAMCVSDTFALLVVDSSTALFRVDFTGMRVSTAHCMVVAHLLIF